MGAFSIWHWLIVLVVVLVLFGGRGKISSLMGDLGKGLKAFKANIKEDIQPKDNPTELSSDTADLASVSHEKVDQKADKQPDQNTQK